MKHSFDWLHNIRVHNQYGPLLWNGEIEVSNLSQMSRTPDTGYGVVAWQYHSSHHCTHMWVAATQSVRVVGTPTLHSRPDTLRLPFIWAFKAAPFWKTLQQRCGCSMWNAWLAIRVEPDFYCKGMDNFITHCDIFLHRQGDYVEK
jgi:hypothetical protein